MNTRTEGPRKVGKDELAANNGENGRPLWVAYRGGVFDLSSSPLWEGGFHMGSHNNAGKDLTDEINEAPHGPEMLERFPRVGILATEEEARDDASPSGEAVPARSVPDLLTRFPMLKRHPHPMTVHFPIALGVLAPMFMVLYLIFDVPGFERTSFHCLGAGLVFIPVAMLTGYVTWRINYGGKPIRAVTIKKTLSVVLLVLNAAAFAWRWQELGLTVNLSGAGALYFLIVLLLAPMVAVIGWFGATLTFPLAKQKGMKTGG